MADSQQKLAALSDIATAHREGLLQMQANGVKQRFAQKFGVRPVDGYGQYVVSPDGLVFMESAAGEFRLMGICPKCGAYCPSDPVTLETLPVLLKIAFFPTANHVCTSPPVRLVGFEEAMLKMRHNNFTFPGGKGGKK